MSSVEQEVELIEKLKKHCLDKLRENCTKTHWNDVTLKKLFEYLFSELSELMASCIVANNSSPAEVWREAGDVSNFASMIADNFEKLYNERNKVDER